jgi:hypothetical protein
MGKKDDVRVLRDENVGIYKTIIVKSTEMFSIIGHRFPPAPLFAKNENK